MSVQLLGNRLCNFDRSLIKKSLHKHKRLGLTTIPVYLELYLNMLLCLAIGDDGMS